MTDRLMGDSSTYGDVPKKYKIIGAYANGHFGVATKEQMENDYPGCAHVLFDVNGSAPKAEARDWETGDKGGNLERWVGDHNDSTGIADAVVYCNSSTIPEVRRLTGKQILGKDYWLHVATLDGRVRRGPGIMACQNKGQKLTGGHWDESIVFMDRFWVIPEQDHPSDGPGGKVIDVRPLQTAVHVTADGFWGPNTDKHLEAIFHAAVGSFPDGVNFAQQAVGTSIDGVWGPKSKDALKATVANVQRALRGMGFDPGNIDGFWGAHTNTAYLAARAAAHI